MLDTEHAQHSMSMVLVAISDAGPCRPRYPAERLRLSPAGVAKVLDRAEQLGRLVRRNASLETDQRAVSVELTRSGTAIVDDIIDGLQAHLDDVAAAVVEVSRAVRR